MLAYVREGSLNSRRASRAPCRTGEDRNNIYHHGRQTMSNKGWLILGVVVLVVAGIGIGINSSKQKNTRCLAALRKSKIHKRLEVYSQLARKSQRAARWVKKAYRIYSYLDIFGSLIDGDSGGLKRFSLREFILYKIKHIDKVKRARRHINAMGNMSARFKKAYGRLKKSPSTKNRLRVVREAKKSRKVLLLNLKYVNKARSICKSAPELMRAIDSDGNTIKSLDRVIKRMSRDVKLLNMVGGRCGR